MRLTGAMRPRFRSPWGPIPNMRRPSPKLPTVIVLFAALGSACHGHERLEAAEVMRALEVVRAAPKDQKQGPADALGKVPCSAPLVCDARDRCAEVYRHFA